MNFFKIFIKWQFWVSLMLMGLICFGAYHFIFKIWLQSYTNQNQEIEIPDLKSMELSVALKTLEDLKLTYEIDSVRFDSSYAPHTVIDFFPEKGFKVKEGRRIFIKANPQGWSPTTLPDIVGKSKRLAFTQLKLAGLEVGDTIYKTDIAKDAVLGVIFKGKQISLGTELPRFSKVDLVLGKGIEYGVKTPDLLGLTLDEARSSIFSNQFENGRINIEGTVTDSSKLIVFYQYPLPEDNYDQGLPIDLWLSQKSAAELKDNIKALNIQFRNYGHNDSLSIAKFEEEFNLKEKDLPQNTQETENENREIPKEEPGGVEFVD